MSERNIYQRLPESPAFQQVTAYSVQFCWTFPFASQKYPVSRWLMNNISNLFLNHSKVPSSNLFTSQRSTSDTSPKLGVRKFSMEMCRGYPKALIISVKSVQGKKNTVWSAPPQTSAIYQHKYFLRFSLLTPNLLTRLWTIDQLSKRKTKRR